MNFMQKAKYELHFYWQNGGSLLFTLYHVNMHNVRIKPPYFVLPLLGDVYKN